MSDKTLVIRALLGIVSVAGACCLMAFLSGEIRTAFRSLFAVIYGPVARIQEQSGLYLRSTRDWILRQAGDETEREGDGPVYFILGSIMYSILTLLFVLCDFGMAILTLQAFGMDEIRYQLPVDTSTLTGTTLVTTALFWGAILFDLLGVTRLAPWRRSLIGATRGVFVAIAIFFLSLSVAVGGGMAFWRGEILNQPVSIAEASIVLEEEHGGLSTLSENEVSGADRDELASYGGDAVQDDPEPAVDKTAWIIPASLTAISVLCIASSAFSMVGLAIFMKFMILLGCALVALPLAGVNFLGWLLSSLLNSVLTFIEAVLDIPIRVGNGLLRLFRFDRAEAALRTDGGVAETVEGQAEPQPAASAGAVDPGFNPFPRRAQ